MRTTRTSDPAKEPINLDEAKDHLRLDGTDDDAYLMGLIVAARDRAEQETRRAIITQTWQGLLDQFPNGRTIWVRHPNLQSVSSVQYLDDDGDTQTFSSDNYTVSTDGVFGRIVLNDGVSWPSTENKADAVTITFVAGYGDDANDVPQMLRQGIMFAIAHWYEFREPVICGGTVVTVPDSFKAIMSMYRVEGFPGNV